MSKTFGITSWILIMFVCGHSRAERGIVAVFDIEDRDGVLSQEARSNIVDQIVVLMTQRGFQVVPRYQIRERLRQQKIESYRECFDQNCQIELGRELAAQKSLVPTLNRTGNHCQFSLILYDLRRSVTENAASIHCACSQESLSDTTLRVVNELFRPTGSEEKEKKRSESRHFFSFGVSAGLLFPSPLLVGIKEPQDMFLRIDIGGSVFAQALYHWRFLATGIRFGFSGGHATPDKQSYLTSPNDLDFNHLLMEGTFLFNLDLGMFDLRLGFGVGYHTLGGGIIVDYISQVKPGSKRIAGVGLSSYLQGELPLTNRFALLVETGFFASGFKDSMDIPPLIYLSAGVQVRL